MTTCVMESPTAGTSRTKTTVRLSVVKVLTRVSAEDQVSASTCNDLLLNKGQFVEM